MPISMLEVARRADQFFLQTSPVHAALTRLSATLTEMQLSFAIAGAMAANAHGYHRTTADVNILMRREDLQKFKDRWLGRSWVEQFEGSKGFRDTINNVKIDVLLVGEFPGDGLPKPVAFPNPEQAAQRDADGLPFITLETLLELKLASGMTAKHRMQDMADVMNLIRINQLPREFSSNLNPYVGAKYDEVWQSAQVNEDY